MSEPGRFIAAIAALVFHEPTTTYLLLQRSDNVDVGAGEWEVVTGRVEQGESFERAVVREVREEIGADVDLDFIIGTSHFYRGGPSDETEVLGVRYACTIADRDAIRLGSEHQAHRWLTAVEIALFLPADDRVRRMAERAEVLRAGLPARIVALHHREGFLSD